MAAIFIRRWISFCIIFSDRKKLWSSHVWKIYLGVFSPSIFQRKVLQKNSFFAFMKLPGFLRFNHSLHKRTSIPAKSSFKRTCMWSHDPCLLPVIIVPSRESSPSRGNNCQINLWMMSTSSWNFLHGFVLFLGNTNWSLIEDTATWSCKKPVLGISVVMGVESCR